MPVGVEDDEWPEDPPAPGAVPPDPPNVGPSLAPPPSSFAPEDPTDAHRVTAAEMRDDQPEAPAEFPVEFRKDFEGLLYLGKLTDSFEWLGHRFVITTVPVDRVLEVSLLHQEYATTIGDPKAYQTLMVAACIESVDGRQLPSALGPDEPDLVHRFNYVKRWYDPTIAVIYDRFLVLEARVEEVIRAMGEAVG